MTIDFNTPLKNLNFSSEFISFWNDKLLTQYDKNRNNHYSYFSQSDKLPVWNSFQSKENVFMLFDALNDFYRKEKNTFSYEKIDNVSDTSYLSLEIMNILSKDGFSLTEMFHQHYNDTEEKRQYHNLYLNPLFEIYLHHEQSNNRTISEVLIDKYIEIIYQNKQFSDYCSINENIESFSQLLAVIPNEKKSYQWFIKNLHDICFDDDINDVPYNALNYNSQKIIHDIIDNDFNEYIHKEDNKNYYLNLLPSNIITSKRLFQSSITIDMYQFIHQNKFKQNDMEKLCTISTEVLNIIASSEFMHIINQDITVSHLNHKRDLSRIEILFSTEKQEDLFIFENIYLTLLESVLKVSDQINIHWSEDYHSGDNILSTNMNAQFINKHYLYSKLNNQLENKTQKITKLKI